MEKTDSQIVDLLQEQNELLHKLYDSQIKINKAQKHREWFMVFLKLLPFIVVLVVVLYLYFSIQAAVNDLTMQVQDIRESVNSVFTLLTNQFQSINEHFGKLLTGVKGIVPDFGGMADSLKDTFQ